MILIHTSQSYQISQLTMIPYPQFTSLQTYNTLSFQCTLTYHTSFTNFYVTNIHNLTFITYFLWYQHSQLSMIPYPQFISLLHQHQRTLTNIPYLIHYSLWYQHSQLSIIPYPQFIFLLHQHTNHYINTLSFHRTLTNKPFLIHYFLWHQHS